MTCNIASHFMLHDVDVYWFKNGFEKLKFRKIQNHSVGQRLLQSTIELSSSSNDSYSHQGYYQCVIFAQRFMEKEVRSSKLQVQFQGNFFMCWNLIFHFFFPLQKRIRNPVTQLRHNFFGKCFWPLSIFVKSFIMDVRLGSEYAFVWGSRTHLISIWN